MLKNVLSVLLVCSSSMTGSSRNTAHDIVINKNMPGVVITFEQTHVQQDGGERRILLKLHNNYRVPIDVPTFDLGDHQTGAVYEVCSMAKASACEEYGEELITMDQIPPGRDLIVSIPAEHVSDSTYVRIPFDFDGESSAKQGGPAPQHFAIFYGSFLPKSK